MNVLGCAGRQSEQDKFVPVVSGSEWDEQRGGLNTTSCGRHGEKWGWEGGCPHLPGRQDGRGLATRNWRHFQHSWVHIASSCFFNYLGNAVGKRELLYQTHTAAVCSYLSHTPSPSLLVHCSAWEYCYSCKLFRNNWSVGKAMST